VFLHRMTIDHIMAGLLIRVIGPSTGAVLVSWTNLQTYEVMEDDLHHDPRYSLWMGWGGRTTTPITEVDDVLVVTLSLQDIFAHFASTNGDLVVGSPLCLNTEDMWHRDGLDVNSPKVCKGMFDWWSRTLSLLHLYSGSRFIA
jgi:hypothetical protein